MKSFVVVLMVNDSIHSVSQSCRSAEHAEATAHEMKAKYSNRDPERSGIYQLYWYRIVEQSFSHERRKTRRRQNPTPIDFPDRRLIPRGRRQTW